MDEELIQVHATRHKLRVRDFPITLDKVLGGTPQEPLKTEAIQLFLDTAAWHRERCN